MPASARKDRGLAVFGEFFLDLVFTTSPEFRGWAKRSRPQASQVFPGGGLATTALVAVGLGNPNNSDYQGRTGCPRGARRGGRYSTTSNFRSGISTEACEGRIRACLRP